MRAVGGGIHSGCRSRAGAEALAVLRCLHDSRSKPQLCAQQWRLLMGVGTGGMQRQSYWGELQAEWQCRPVAEAVAGSRPTSSTEDLDCWYAFLQLQGLTMCMCVAVEVNDRMQGRCCAGALLQGLPARVLCRAGHRCHSRL